jgi:plastocyanin
MNTKTRGALVALALAAAALIPTVAFAGATAASSHTVTLKNIAFHPGTLSIKRGESVKWVWEDGETEHNVTFKGMRSKTQDHGSYTIRFNQRGTFSYRCTIHASEGMKGKVVVH